MAFSEAEVASPGAVGPLVKRQLIISADDFGRCREINAAVVKGHREGVLTSASLMVTGEAFAEAVELARQMPRLAVGLHVVLVDGRSVLPPGEVPHLVDRSGRFLDDPVRAGLRRLQAKFADLPIRLLVAPKIGENPKSCILHELSLEALHEVLVISDSDIRVTPDYLRRVVAPLEAPRNGLVTCAYRSVAARTLPARLEALYLNTCFVPSAIAAGMVFGTRFGLGATMVMRRRELQECGGYARIADQLADDYHIAKRISSLGLKVVLSDYLATNVLGATRFGQQWQRELRWARTIRGLRPWQYAGLPLTFATPLAVAATVIDRFSIAASGVLAGSLLVRLLAAAGVQKQLHCSRGRDLFLWLPVRDLLSAIVWCRGAVARRVSWRGRTYRLATGDRLGPARVPTGWLRGAAGAAVRRLDQFLRRRQDIYEFSQDRDCFLRLSVTRADRELHLSDGTHLCRGDLVGEMHYWNDRLPRISREGPDLAWACRFHSGMLHSLRLLARYVEANPELQVVKAFHADLPLESRDDARTQRRFRRIFGADFVQPERAPGLRQRLHERGNYLLLWALIWTCNPGSLRGRKPPRCRADVWLSRNRLLDRFGSGHDGRALPDGRATGDGRASGDGEASSDSRAPRRLDGAPGSTKPVSPNRGTR